MSLLEAAPDSAAECVDGGHRLSVAGRYAEAEALYRRAIDLAPRFAVAHSNLGWVRHMQGDDADAVACFRHALALEPSLRIARRHLAVRLVQLGRDEESLSLFRAELETDGDGLDWMQQLVSDALTDHAVTLAAAYASLMTRLRWGSRWYPAPAGVGPPVARPDVYLTRGKLRHDIEQLEFLRDRGVLCDVTIPAIDAYRRVLARMPDERDVPHVLLDDAATADIGDYYSRILHIPETGRVERALSTAWEPEPVEDAYLNTPPGVVVIDDFLSPEALDGVRRFSLESTIWFANRYAHERLGAFFRDGFNCPLLLQIAEELRAAMPRVIGDRYPLRQLWGFKNAATLPADAVTHADFAAVNVNFWITPEDANPDPDSGGLVVYDVDAPLSWDFDTYNGKLEVINSFVRNRARRAIRIPYRQNRAVIFNSDLFHGTAAVNFKPGYENRRMNVTMLYGEREQEVHHRELSGPEHRAGDPATQAWRSAAFSRARR